MVSACYLFKGGKISLVFEVDFADNWFEWEQYPF